MMIISNSRLARYIYRLNDQRSLKLIDFIDTFRSNKEENTPIGREQLEFLIEDYTDKAKMFKII